MQIHLAEISSNEGRTEHFSVPFEMNMIRFQEGDFHVLSSEPLDLVIENTGERVLKVTGKGSVTVSIPCSRCLTDTEVRIPLGFELKLDMKLTDEQRVNDLDESSYLTGTDLDTDRMVYLEVLMNWPQKVLCSENCAGLCPVCGKNLNEGSCGCDEGPKDPRMAAVSDIFRKFKEV